MTECVGLHYQILLRNYSDAKRRMRQIFVELIRVKLLEIDPEYDDEVNYFLDVMETFMEKDYSIKKSLELSKEYSKYYVSPHLFESLIEICKKEIHAVKLIDKSLQDSIMKVREFI